MVLQQCALGQLPACCISRAYHRVVGVSTVLCRRKTCRRLSKRIPALNRELGELCRASNCTVIRRDEISLLATSHRLQEVPLLSSPPSSLTLSASFATIYVFALLLCLRCERERERERERRRTRDVHTA